MAQHCNVKAVMFKNLCSCAVVLFVELGKVFFSPGFTGMFIAASNLKKLHWSRTIFSIQFKMERLRDEILI